MRHLEYYLAGQTESPESRDCTQFFSKVFREVLSAFELLVEPLMKLLQDGRRTNPGHYLVSRSLEKAKGGKTSKITF